MPEHPSPNYAHAYRNRCWDKEGSAAAGIIAHVSTMPCQIQACHIFCLDLCCCPSYNALIVMRCVFCQKSSLSMQPPGVESYLRRGLTWGWGALSL